MRNYVVGDWEEAMAGMQINKIIKKNKGPSLLRIVMGRKERVFVA